MIRRIPVFRRDKQGSIGKSAYFPVRLITRLMPLRSIGSRLSPGALSIQKINPGAHAEIQHRRHLGKNGRGAYKTAGTFPDKGFNFFMIVFKIICKIFIRVVQKLKFLNNNH
jgi:hypothetical protein